MDTNQTMKAAVLEVPGGKFLLQDVKRPIPGEGEVLVKIHASSVNPLDIKISAGSAAHARHPLPAVLGIDLAGVVEDIGKGVKDFKIGDEVYGMTGGVGGIQGSLAQYAAVDALLLAHKPSNLTMREAAALPLIFITAWEGLIDRANVSAGDNVLIQGGAGGVGHIAVQLAKAFNANVFAVDRGSKGEFLKSLGATPIDYTTIEVAEYVMQYTAGQGFDIVYDTGGGAILDASFAAVHRFGHVVSCLGWGTHSLSPLSFKSATYSGVFTLHPLLTGEGRNHHGEILRNATKLVEEGKIKPKLDPRRFNLSDIEEAHDIITNRKADGKIVIDIN